MSHELKYGLFLGVITVAFSATLFLIDYKLFQNPVFASIPFVVNVVILFVAGFELRKKNDGYLTFKKALTSTFIIYAIAATITMIYTVLQYNVFTPDIAETLQKESLNQQVAIWESIGMSDEQIDAAAADAQSRNIFGLTWQLVGLAGNLVLGFVISLIVAAIVKKKEPEFI